MSLREGKTKVRLWEKAEWEIFANYMKNSRFFFPTVVNEKKLDKMVSGFYAEINKALDKAAPVVTIEHKNKIFLWYTEEHEKRSKCVNKLYIRAMKSRKTEDLIEYKKERKLYIKRCKKDRNRAWKRYIDCIKETKEVSRLTKILQKSERNNVNVFDNIDGTTTEPGEDTLEALLKTHFKECTPIKHTKYNSSGNINLREIASKYEDWISLEKIKEALEGFEKKKSPGPDGIKPLVFEHLPEKKHYYTFNSFISAAYIFTILRNSGKILK